MKIRIVLALALLSIPVSLRFVSAEKPAAASLISPKPAPTPAASCPNPKMLKNLCMMIGEQMSVSNDPKDKGRPFYETRPFNYMYEKRFHDAACVLESDSEEIAFEKIRNVWSIYEEEYLHCTNIQFDVSRGHLLKYAVASSFDHFIDDAIKWGVNLNKVDESDGRTVLDYIRFHMNVNKGTAMEQRLKSYYDKLRAAGAKHKAELKK